MTALNSKVTFLATKLRGIIIPVLPEALDTTVELWRLYFMLQSMVQPRFVSHEDNEKPPSR